MRRTQGETLPGQTKISTMVNQAKLDEVRKIILSCLLSRKGPTSIPILERDYREAEQERIPYRQFGYTDLVAFLQSMPEYFIVEEYNGGHTVRGIASEKSKHVSSLVERQKTVDPRSRYIPPHLRESYNRRVPHMKSQRVKIAPDKLLLLMKFIKNNPYGVSMQNALLYVQELVPFVNISIHDLRDQVRELSHLLVMDGNMIYSVQNNVSQDNVTHQQPLVNNPVVNKSLMPQSPSNSELPSTTQTIYAAGQEDPNWIEDFSDENDFVTVNHSAGKCQRREKTSEQLATNLAQHMKHEKPDMFNSNNVKNNVEINVDDYFATMNSKSNAEMNTAERLDVSEIISDRVKFRLEELLRKHPEGIWCAELPDKFLQEYKVGLNYTRLGFPSVREFTSYLPNIFYMTQRNKTGDFLLYSADKRPVVPKTDPIDITQASSYNRYDEHNTVQAQCNNDDDAPVPSNVSPTITQRFAPVYAMNYNDNVEKILVTELKRTRKYLEVYIIEVFHPNFFWIHLRENVKRFNKMMDDLCDFYQHNKDEYVIAKVALKKGLNCACVYVNRWHRGIIKSVKPDFRTTVFFYDYGTLKTYAPEDLYYLHKDFSYLPAQAIPCGLYNVKPNVGDRWKRSVIDQFIDKVADTLLAATIITIDPTHNSMMISLSDTSEEEDVNINEWLVQERLAQNGKTTDAVDMASIMRYVVNNLNQLPTYCFAEENLMPDNHYKATSTEEKHEVPSVPTSGPTLPCCDNHQQQQPVRPPPGFLPLGEQRVPANASTKGFHNSYSFANVNAKIFGETETTNPFLADQFNPNDIYQQIYMSVCDENKKLQIRLFDILYDLLERLQLTFKDQIRLNRILKIVEKVLLELLQKEDCSIMKTSSVSNVTSGSMFSDVGSVRKAPYNLNSETPANQELNANIFSTSNPFDTNSNDRSRNNATFSTYSSDSFAFKTNWSQSDELSPRVQVPPSATASPSPSMFLSHTPVSTFLSSACQSENVPLTPLSPTIPTNTSIPNNLEFVDNVNNQFVNMLKDTNPFKFPTNKINIPETQNERTIHDYDANIVSYLSANPQNYASKTNTANNQARSNCFTSAGHVNENYTPRIVYESGPVMYNMQKKKVDADARQNICSSDLHNAQNTQNAQSLESGQCDKKSTPQPANNFTLHKQHKITRDNSQIDESYVTRSSPYHMQDSQPIINGELNYYQQNSNTNNLRPVSSQAWNQNEISEHWKNLKFQNSIPLSNHNENAVGTLNTLPHQDWNCDNGRKSMPREMNEVTDSSFKFKDDRDREKPMDIYANFWCNTENGSVQHRSATCNISSFLFQKIDLVKGVTFIFNIEQEGWMLAYEFVETFTNLKLYSRLLATLEAMNIKVVFKEIQRSEYPMQFSQLDRYPLNVPRDSEKRIISINLISLQTALALLHKLRIVSREEIENAFKKNEFLDDSVLPVLWSLIVTYRDMRRSIELCSNYI